MTHLRKLMLEELQRRNYSQTTVTAYVKTSRTSPSIFGKRPDQLGPDDIRQYQAVSAEERKLGVRTVAQSHCGAAVLLSSRR